MVKSNNPVAPLETGERSWLRKHYVSLLIIFLVMAITASLFVYRDRIAQFHNYGYLGAFLINLLTNATVILPMPGILLLFPLGAAFNPVLIGLAGGLGAGIGEMTCYTLGFSGRAIIENRRFYDSSVGWLKKWGALTVFIFALTPLPFDVMGIAAGALRFPFWQFLLACWLGKTVLSIGVALAGAWGWQTFVTGRYLTSPISVGLLAVLATLALLLLALAIESWTWKRGK